MTELLQNDEYERRFAGVAKIYGDEAFNYYEHSHVMVIGIGGVGSWAVEALARSGIGELTLVDMDVVAASNINRQLPAMTATLGQEKIAVMAERCYSINPRIKVNLVDDYLSSDNVKEILAMAPDLVLDCIDDVKAKLALMLHCRFNKIPLIVSGGAGGKLDPLKIRVADLSKTEQDPMLAKLRTQLRSKGICKKPKEKFGITCIYSIDNPFSNSEVCASAGLRCGGYGSAVVVTSSFAMVAVAEVLRKLEAIKAKQ
ncbi:tRNA threonylcarbamoyladenosine dehydratase [Acinetobacter radioresistens]|uniref:tRNA threonylcarbamoyladenosine dehydratase n=1 Tax=Acinetobacter radioresistens TaxID=40216 RepID=UPI000C32B1D5|nr:tRNA threonylcarbamoyladenosine dehydratase [Acinetobacter radioresistens]MCM1934352.1 tRNA threonylcarbamoyladenosine dehydratase [Acinetobacter radioresistens]MCM1951853.1 tRNA threonylcarbamoyladenosine dehydratase [Acinetobacter radioresistens]MCU4307679.1 tRNA threonylcarbamoyladenosine dehydratase [Acinetobacter radioresistens]MCU4565577.1 tRNA threonylcarbamoyladenosine dehydratase [Acinetobacter radioresistens]PKH35316.1 tRNA threonylcarbamoyladenosine dehydratase [Acinetobacter rad